MRKGFLVMLAMSLLLVGTLTFAGSQGSGDTTNNYYQTTNNEGGQGGQGGSATVNNENRNTNINTNLNANHNDNRNINMNSNRQGQAQGQAQGQMQGQGQLQGQNQDVNNSQNISPSQTMIVEKPYRAYPNMPSTVSPELNFVPGIIQDVGVKLPKFGIALLTNTDEVKEVVDITANIPFKKLYRTILAMKKAEEPLSYNLRIQVIMADGQKTWTTGGSISGLGAYAGQGGAAAVGSIIPAVGGTKAHPLFTIVLVKVK